LPIRLSLVTLAKHTREVDGRRTRSLRFAVHDAEASDRLSAASSGAVNRPQGTRQDTRELWRFLHRGRLPGCITANATTPMMGTATMVSDHTARVPSSRWRVRRE